MKIEIEISNAETLAKALNNALLLYADAISAINLCGSAQISSKKFSSLTTLSAEELTNRLIELENIYKQIETIEKQGDRNE